MVQDPHSLSWVRKGKLCAISKKPLDDALVHYSALLETEKGIARLDIHEDYFSAWKAGLDHPKDLVAWWKVYKWCKAEEKKEKVQNSLSFAQFYEKHISSRPDLVLRLALLLQKMKGAVVEKNKEGWLITLKEGALSQEQGQWQLGLCQLRSRANQQKEDNEQIREFFTPLSEE